MRLYLALKEKLFDVRLTDKLLAEGKLSKSDLKKNLEQLEDMEGKSTFTESQIDQSIFS